MLDMTAFAAAGARLYVGEPTAGTADFIGQPWTQVARLETLGSFAGGLEVIARLDDLDIGQGILRASAYSKASRAFRVVFPDGSERLFVASILSARERASARLRAVLMVQGEVTRTSARVLAVAS